MTPKISLVFGIHNHQPVGNFDQTFESACRDAYLPFLRTLSEYPWFPFAFHTSGPLIDYLEDHHPEFFDLVGEMVDRGQIEIMTGGYYEPILPVIPDPDKKGQIRKMTRYLKERFGRAPRGMWLAERVWEPHLPGPLAQAGVRYVTMDDSHFIAAGLEKDELYGYYVTEEAGRPLAIFPISEKLRYLIPFRPPEETVEYLRSLATPDGERLLVIADDGEKFGVWPDTHEWVYTKGWLRNFLDTMEEHRDWIRLLTFDQALGEHRSLGPIFIPTASYTEMMEWVLPPDRTNALEALRKRPESEPYLPFLRGGFWRNYLAKYRESNNLHKRMLLVSGKVHRMRGAGKERALERLWAAQCNCGYWHGVFGGLYLNHIRAAIYRNLIEAEVLAEEEALGAEAANPGMGDDAAGRTVPGPMGATATSGAVVPGEAGSVQVEIGDFYRDGGRCLLVHTPVLNLYFDLDKGAHLFELDHKPRRFNLLNTLTRRKEAYHERLLHRHEEKKPDAEGTRSIHDLVLVKEEGLEKMLFYDWYRRSAFIDHFLGADADREDFRQSTYPEAGNFVDRPYEVAWEETGGRAEITLAREGRVWNGSEGRPVRVERVLRIEPDSGDVGIQYRLESKAGDEIRTRFGVGFGFAMQAGDTPDRYYRFSGTDERARTGAVGERSGLEWVSLTEEWVGIEARVEWEKPFDLWYFPIETVSSSEAGFERTYQSSVVLPHWEVALPPGGSWTVEGRLRVMNFEA